MIALIRIYRYIHEVKNNTYLRTISPQRKSASEVSFEHSSSSKVSIRVRWSVNVKEGKNVFASCPCINQRFSGGFIFCGLVVQDPK
jgi:hypothetical protein